MSHTHIFHTQVSHTQISPTQISHTQMSHTQMTQELRGSSVMPVPWEKVPLSQGLGPIFGPILRPILGSEKHEPRVQKKMNPVVQNLRPKSAPKTRHENRSSWPKSIGPLQRRVAWERFRPQFWGPISASEMEFFFQIILDHF